MSKQYGIPVISIGNLTMGGSGKTPVAREILRLLHASGIDAHALSRGYGGRLEGPVRVDPAAHSAAASSTPGAGTSASTASSDFIFPKIMTKTPQG